MENLLSNADCETLDGWAAWNGDLLLGTPARSGTYACLVCTNLTASISSLDSPTGDNEVLDPKVGDVYRASAWVRAGAGVEGAQAQLRLRETSVEGDVLGNTGGEQPVIDDGDWIHLEAAHEIGDEVTAFFDMYVTLEGADAPCMLVDDMLLWLEP